MRSFSALALSFCLTVPSLAAAQTVIQYDTVAADADAAVTCGFCATEKFGVMFYELGQGGGLPASAFPFQLNAMQVAVAGTQTTGDIFTGYMCAADNSGGQVNTTIEIYTGVTPPTNIEMLPGSGAWPGETTVLAAMQAPLTRSIETTPGSNQYSIQLNAVPVNVTVNAPNTYVRAVVNVSSGLSSSACMDLGLQSPAISPFRDNNGLISNNRNFIYQLGIFGMPSRWTWSENVNDPITGQMGIRGDWMVRLDITPAQVQPDAGVPDTGGVDAGPPADAGDTDGAPADTGPVADGGPADTSPVDTGTPMPDTGVVADAGPQDAAAVDAAVVDAGAGLPPVIDAISPDTAAEGSDTQVTVIGENFVTDVELRIGQIRADVKVVNGSTTFLADIPSAIASGTYDVVVTNPDGQSDILVDGFTITGESGPAPDEGGCGCSSANKTEGVLGLACVLLLGFVRRRR